MKDFLLTSLATALGNVVVFLLYQGFVHSYWGRNCREEISRWFDRMAKHMRKQKEK